MSKDREFPKGYDVTYSQPGIISCPHCAFYYDDVKCDSVLCLAKDRNDGREVYFTKKKTRKK